ncbi:TlpA family protein disulfide reductase [Altibacter sp. HG106]|uniref:TlpA family protein disulfide reductase n=1 Tax=Altibacter sp. HG106 TaxID=3023937 RepID=UPI002350A554|nr:thioredoxin family protein [Altibacter sp. HG106]MDC7995910.1 thioredoxin family protein [Altibacter sp. HG106]
MLHSIFCTFLCCFLTVSLSAQSFNQRITQDDASLKLVGSINKEALSSEPFAAWFSSEWEAYQPDASIVASLQTQLSEYTITAFMGTWCGDSQREIPRFYKVLEAAAFPLDRLQLIALDNDRSQYKQSPGGEEEGLGIHRVPTFVVYKNHREIGRIVESPKTSLEADLLAIITSETYEPKYPEVTFIIQQLKNQGAASLHEPQPYVIAALKERAQDLRGMLTYSSVLLAAEEPEAAVAVATLATLVFPEEYYTFVNLGNKLQAVGKREAGIAAYEKALDLHPDDKNLQETIAVLKGAKAD